MAVKIRLTRTGRKNDPKYRIVVVEEGKKRDGAYIDLIGHYDPIPKVHVLNYDKEKLSSWLLKGAQLSEGAHKLLKKHISSLS